MKSLKLRNFEVSPEDASEFLWYEASRYNTPFYKPVIVERAAMVLVDSLYSWAEKDRNIVYNYVELCFSMMVRDGCFERNKTGDYIGNYSCIHAPKSLTSSQLQFSFEDDTIIPAPRISIVVSRIVRDTKAATSLKELYGSCCQLCKITLCVGEYNYCEAHHLRPLGTPHDGPDCWDNMIILCPNHHVLFDYGVPVWHEENKVEVGGEFFVLETRHTLKAAYIDYYRQHLQLRKSITESGQ